MDPAGQTQSFVLAQGFRRENGRLSLIGYDGRARLLAELTADADRPEVRPREAYRVLLASLQPGWTVRLLQISWPDPVPRGEFTQCVEGWGEGQEVGEGLELLHQGLLLFAQDMPLPFTRRTILEFACPGEEGAAWWQGLAGLLMPYGVEVRQLAPEQVRELARWIFNPSLA